MTGLYIGDIALPRWCINSTMCHVTVYNLRVAYTVSDCILACMEWLVGCITQPSRKSEELGVNQPYTVICRSLDSCVYYVQIWDLTNEKREWLHHHPNDVSYFSHWSIWISNVSWTVKRLAKHCTQIYSTVKILLSIQIETWIARTCSYFNLQYLNTAIFFAVEQIWIIMGLTSDPPFFMKVRSQDVVVQFCGISYQWVHHSV